MGTGEPGEVSKHTPVLYITSEQLMSYYCSITTDSEHTFTGDRNKDDIIQFVSRVAGPPVRELATAKDFTEIKQSRRVFFAFIGDKSGEFWETYFDVAKRFQPFSHFYVLKEEVAKQLLTVPLVPSLFVYQDNEPSYFSGKYLFVRAKI